MEYTSIGHGNPKDIIWIFMDEELNKVTRGETLTHTLLWGKDIDNYWRGRYEKSTGYCSIAPPADKLMYARPSQAILDILTSNFSVTKFFYFAQSGPVVLRTRKAASEYIACHVKPVDAGPKGTPVYDYTDLKKLDIQYPDQHDAS